MQGQLARRILSGGMAYEPYPGACRYDLDALENMQWVETLTLPSRWSLFVDFISRLPASNNNVHSSNFSPLQAVADDSRVLGPTALARSSRDKTWSMLNSRSSCEAGNRLPNKHD